MKWQSLRPIQESAIQSVMTDDLDLIISANTASGKTEAAFLPVLSKIYNESQPSIQAMYVGPLKALINDQFRRLEGLCHRAEIPVYRWHGDVDASRKKKLIRNPRGVLLITPESIESLLLNRTSHISHVFRHLEFVVIDEIHALVGSVRGTHLRSLLARLRRRTEQDFRMIGLSATLGDAFPMYQSWLRPDGDRNVKLISGESETKRLLYKIHGFEESDPTEANKQPDDDNSLPDGVSAALFEHFAGSRNLIFANNKSDVELYADALNTACRFHKRPEEFLVHHGSLSKDRREHTERQMQGRRPRTTLCSSTLELGIDIGNVAAVGQIGQPWSVNSLVQRIGRSGREDGEPQRMRIYIIEKRLTAKSTLFDKLHLNLLHAAAVTELMLERPAWVEPPSDAKLDFSTFSHQVLSILAETGGELATAIYYSLCVVGAFRHITQKQFAQVLRSLAECELIEQMTQGELILAPKGEKLVRHYSFYSSFASGIEYSVVHGGATIGMLPGDALPQDQDHLLLGGRRWQVVGTDHERREVTVKRAKGKKPPKFIGGGGDTHPRIRQKMKQILCEQRNLPYLDPRAAGILEQARQTANMNSLNEVDVVSTAAEGCFWFTWTGTKIHKTLCLLAQKADLSIVDHKVAIEFTTVTKDELPEVLSKLAAIPVAPIQLAQQIQNKQVRKLDEYLSDDLLSEAMAIDDIDLPEALERLHLPNLVGTAEKRKDNAAG